MLLCFDLLNFVLEFDFLFVQGEKLIAHKFLFTLNLSLDQCIRHLDSVALDEAVSTHSQYLLVPLHTIVIVKELHNWVVLVIVLLGQLHLAQKVARSMLANLNRAVVEANR